LPRYYSPYGNYGYQRFGIGLFLDRLFYDQRYWLDDPYSYRLPPAEYGTQWVRYYNDVLLVDIDTGEVLDVIHDFFW
jgi:Ni/Co efflux regulator RcnB